jgi:hypothetical protein
MTICRLWIALAFIVCGIWPLRGMRTSISVMRLRVIPDTTTCVGY